jgi:hypothetical protein
MATTLTPEQTKALVKQHFEVFVNRRDAAAIHRNMTPDFLDHDGPDGKPTGVAGDEQMMLAMYAAMPDLRISVEDIIAEKIAERWATVTRPAEDLEFGH